MRGAMLVIIIDRAGTIRVRIGGRDGDLKLEDEAYLRTLIQGLLNEGASKSLARYRSTRAEFDRTAFANRRKRMFGGKIGAAELLIILAIALIFFGPSKLSEMGKGLGDAIRNLKGAMKDGEAAASGESAADQK